MLFKKRKTLIREISKFRNKRHEQKKKTGLEIVKLYFNNHIFQVFEESHLSYVFAIYDLLRQPKFADRSNKRIFINNNTNRMLIFFLPFQQLAIFKQKKTNIFLP